jgi:hypothetical protein
MAETSTTVISRPSTPKTGAPAQLKLMSEPKILASVNRDRPLFHDAGADAVCASNSSDHTPPSQVPQCLNSLGTRIFAAMRDYDA